MHCVGLAALRGVGGPSRSRGLLAASAKVSRRSGCTSCFIESKALSWLVQRPSANLLAPRALPSGRAFVAQAKVSHKSGCTSCLPRGRRCWQSWLDPVIYRVKGSNSFTQIRLTRLSALRLRRTHAARSVTFHIFGASCLFSVDSAARQSTVPLDSTCIIGSATG